MVPHCGFTLAATEASDLIEENPAPLEIAGRDVRLDRARRLTLRLLPAAQ